MIYFTADTHFYHKNIIDHCKRGHKDVLEMNEDMINKWNERITPSDTVYHLGDFAFCGVKKAIEIVERLNGIKYWVPGNHDKELTKKADFIKYWERIQSLTSIKIRKHEQIPGIGIVDYNVKLVLCHFPLLSWEGMASGSWMLHGHCHGSLDEKYRQFKRMDVGVDCNKLYPFSLTEVEEYMASIHPVWVDHHRPEIRQDLQGGV